MDPDPFDLDALRLPPAKPRMALPRHLNGDPFIQGPISPDWLASACRLPGVGLHVAMAYRLHAKRFAFSGGRHWGVGDTARGLWVCHATAQRGLRMAEKAGLLSVDRKPGCKPVVSVLEIPESAIGRKRRPLYGPIPWSWWLPASRLPGKSLQLAAVCWLLAGWERSAEFELAMDDWSEFGLSRFSASRGLSGLERAGLVVTTRGRGRVPIVQLEEPHGCSNGE
jgi:hypothetical protein